MLEARIYQAPACPAIDLNDAEAEIYRGTGWCLAVEKDGQIVEMRYLHSFEDPEPRDTVEDAANAALQNAVAWLSNTKDPVWLGMCSGYTFCDPERVTLADGDSIAGLARVMGEAFTDLFGE